MTTATRFLIVPAGSSAGKCKSPNCGATIYWTRTGFGATPVDCDVDGGRRPSETNDGQGVNHFTTCPDANSFKRRR